MELLVLEGILLCMVATFQWLAYKDTVEVLKQQASIFPFTHGQIYHKVTGAFQPPQIERVDAEFVEATLKSNHNLMYVRFFQSEDGSTDLHTGPRPEEITLIGGYLPHPVFQFIQRDVNIYLVRNHHRSTDFKVIQDIVERHCQLGNNKAENGMSLPLYYGLLGTIVGIIIGCMHISIAGADDVANVSALLLTVALSMSVSGLGLWLTVFSVTKHKKTIDVVERGKNGFLTFVQSELLPVMRSDVQQSLITMENGLRHFNESFQNNVKKFDSSLGAISENLSLQKTFLTKLDQIGYVQMVKETVEIFEQLAKSADTLKDFNQYQQGLNTTLLSLEQVIGRFENLYQRTENFEESIKRIAESINRQDDTYHRLLRILEADSSEIGERQKALHKLMDQLSALFNEQYATLAVHTERQNEELIAAKDKHLANTNAAYDSFQLAITQKTQELKKMAENEMAMLEELYRSRQAIFDNLGRLPDIEKSLNKMSKHQYDLSEIKELSKAVKELVEQINENASTRVINWHAIQNLFRRNNSNYIEEINEKSQ
jgi:uncharacterized protein YsxB (DUF464 family)